MLGKMEGNNNGVCQSFAVLEDGVLAHNLQEQEIEQYYTTNIQKNQLMQSDIRVAKQLQDEEEEQRAQHRALLRQQSRQLEEQDLEYAHVIQEEIRRRAEEAWRRERDDEQMAKQIQEEEEQMMWRAREEEEHRQGSSSGSAPPSPKQHALNRHHPGEARYSPTTARWQYSNTPNPPDKPPPPRYPGRGGHEHPRGQPRRELQESLHADSVFFEQRPNKRQNTAPLNRRSSLRLPRERDYRTLATSSSIVEEPECWGQYRDNGDQEKRTARDWEQEMNRQVENGTWTMCGSQNGAAGLAQAGERRCSRSESVRIPDRPRHGSDLSRTWSYRDGADKRVHFAADAGRSGVRPDTSMQVWEMLGQVLRERGVPVSLGGSGAPLKIGLQSPESQALHTTDVPYGDSRPHRTAFQRAASARHSFHGDIRERRRLSHRENSERDYKGSEDCHQNTVVHSGERSHISGVGWHLSNGQRQGSQRWRCQDGGSATCEDAVERSAGRHRHETVDERFNSEEERERGAKRHPRRSLSGWLRGRRLAAGASLALKTRQTSLDLGDLQQVLHDEELACKLQEQENKLLARTSQPQPFNPRPEGDFRVAQVAQDEEIARYMQKQEIKSKRLSRELEGPESWREHRAMMSHHDRRQARDTQAPRERLDSEGLPYPTEECSPENQPPSPIAILTQSQQVRNIVEELDPTFQAKSQGADILQMDQSDSPGQLLPNSRNFLVEPTFIPPIKRQKDKAGCTKAKEKKENCKQQ
ncbi:coiled-coil domain-containing protein 187 isoform X2 [Hippocampus zosterae]|uniref:coiled-coil domain-containing protein 187 isoform X2 n=1 Tax=Hippocampus zosterae TaxID=109293 RepID=UPI00223CFDF2|nr:coiled-coil domain-containing protein 187 isoform X2 [Hippocampus zosterae]